MGREFTLNPILRRAQGDRPANTDRSVNSIAEKPGWFWRRALKSEPCRNSPSEPVAANISEEVEPMGRLDDLVSGVSARLAAARTTIGKRLAATVSWLSSIAGRSRSELRALPVVRWLRGQFTHLVNSRPYRAYTSKPEPMTIDPWAWRPTRPIAIGFDALVSRIEDRYRGSVAERLGASTARTVQRRPVATASGVVVLLVLLDILRAVALGALDRDAMGYRLVVLSAALAGSTVRISWSTLRNRLGWVLFGRRRD